MIKRVKLETIYKIAKEDNEKIEECKTFPDGWDEKVYDYYNKLSKDSYDVEMFMGFLSGEDSPLEQAYAYRRNMYIMLYTMNATDTMAFVDSEYDIFYIVSKDGDDYSSWEWCFTNNIDPIKYRGDDGDEPVPEWLIKKYEEQIREEKKMKKTIDLLNAAVEMGFNREQALVDIDASLDAELEERKPLMEEEIPESLYNDILEGFRADKEMNA